MRNNEAPGPEGLEAESKKIELAEPTAEEVNLIWSYINKLPERTMVALKIAGYEPDDLFQEFILKLGNIRSRYNPEKGAYKPYLFTSLKNKLNDILSLKWNALEQALGEKSKQGIEGADESIADRGESTEREERRILGENVVSRIFQEDNPFGLTKMELEVLNYLVLKEMKQLDFAALKGLQPHAVSDRYQRAVRKIRAAIKAGK